jgi:FkbM family methyltransferase
MLAMFLDRRAFADPHRQRFVEFKNPRARFRVRSPMDIWSIKEAFADRFYTRFGYAVELGWTVVDIGAAIGEFTVFAAMVPNTRVLAYEPSSSSAAVLVENLRLNQIENVVLERAGVGSDFDRLELDTSGDPLRMGTRESGTLASSERVDVVPLSSVLERAGGSIDLLKLDCEGAEYDILMKAPAEVLKHIARIVLEYHDPAAIGRQLELAAHLKAAGFDVEWWPNAVHPKTLGYMRARRTA